VSSADLSTTRFGGRLLFDSGSLWQLWQNGEGAGAGSVLRFASPRFGPIPYKVIHLDAQWSRADVAVHTGYEDYRRVDRPSDPFEYPLDELLVMHWLSQGRGIELHASGVVDQQGRGYLFCGQSGAGKSTTARAWLDARPGTVLSDDRIVVRHEQSRFWIYGTPWHGDAALATPARAPLAAVFLLRQSAHTHLVRIPTAQAVARLLACAFFPLYDPTAIGFAMESIGHLVQSVPCVELALERGPGFLKLLDQV
jgi:hypothetical protein